MIPATETNLWRSLTSAFKLYDVNATRIETGSTKVGVGDVTYVVTDGDAGWLELKAAVYPSKPSTSSRVNRRLTIEQFVWLAQHDNPKKFRRSYVLVGLAGERSWSYILLEPAASRGLIDDKGHVFRNLEEWSALPGARFFEDAESVAKFLISKKI